MYQVLARKRRPQTFESLIGQQHIARTLRNAIEADRLAHAYIFSGLRGTGKTSVARILAKCLNCEKGPTPDPCNECTPCTEITQGRSIDVLEMDAASRTGVGDIRELQEVVSYAPARDRFKVLIIDEVHMLSKSAFNALLKTLEEPPPRVAFILATTEIQKVLPTILSCCQVFEFRRQRPGSIDGVVPPNGQVSQNLGLLRQGLNPGYGYPQDFVHPALAAPGGRTGGQTGDVARGLARPRPGYGCGEVGGKRFRVFRFRREVGRRDPRFWILKATDESKDIDS